MDVLVQVVGVSPDTGEAIRARVRSLEELKEKTECELRRVLLMAGHLPASLRYTLTWSLSHSHSVTLSYHRTPTIDDDMTIYRREITRV